MPLPTREQRALVAIIHSFGLEASGPELRELTGCDDYALSWIAKGALARPGVLEHLETLAEFGRLLNDTLFDMTGHRPADPDAMATWLRTGKIDTDWGPRPAQDLSDPKVAASALKHLRAAIGDQ